MSRAVKSQRSKVKGWTLPNPPIKGRESRVESRGMGVLRRLAIVAVVQSVLTACEYKELCYDHNHWAEITVEFDWSKATTANCESMTVLFYNVANPDAEPIRYDFAGNTGGKARLNPGTYRVVGYNKDTETILFRHYTSADSLEAYTRQSSIEEGSQISRVGMPRAPGTETEPVILEPDPFYAAASAEVTLERNDRDRTIVITPEYRYTTLSISINNVPNLQYTGQFGGTLSGLAAARQVVSGELSSATASQAFPARVVNDSTLQMEFRIFGHCPHFREGITNTHLLTIYAVLADNSQWYYTIDITQKFHDAVIDEQTEHIDITIDEGIPIPKPIVNGSGFQPTIDGWQGIEIDVGM